MKILPPAVLLLASLAASVSAAAPPTVVDIDPGYSFVEYSDSVAVGRGDVNIASTLFYIDEGAADGWKSWYLFFDPGVVQDLGATLHFDQPIHAVLTTRAELGATNVDYGADSITYATSRFMGLESCPIERVFCDAVSWVAGGHDLTLDWTALDPGDHIRVLVAVPEPSNYALFAAGLLGLGIALRRRRG